MQYKNYTAKIEYKPDDNVLVGKVIGIRDSITFEAVSTDDIETEFHNAVDDYLEFCEEKGVSPDKTYNGNISLRLSSPLHREVALSADMEGENINTWIVRAVEKEIEICRYRRARKASSTIIRMTTTASNMNHGEKLGRLSNVPSSSNAPSTHYTRLIPGSANFEFELAPAQN